MSIEVTDEMRSAYFTAWGANGCSIKAGIAAVLEIVEREHHAALEARADAAYERGIADTQADIAKRIADAYTRGSKDNQALTDLGF